MSYRRTKLLFRPFTQPKENNEERYSYLKLRACDCVEAASHEAKEVAIFLWSIDAIWSSEISVKLGSKQSQQK